MKQFLYKLFLFLLPLFLGTILLLVFPASKKRAYYYLKNDCEGRGAWMYSRIFESSKAIDVAFLGSSHTINGVNDSLISIRSGLEVCNLGYCRLGRDLTYVLMKELLPSKNTQTFIIEVLPEENPFSHPVFAYLADASQLLDVQTPINRSYLPNLYNGILARWDYVKQDMFNEPYPFNYVLNSHYGFTTNGFMADTNELNKMQRRREAKRGRKNDWNTMINTPFPKAWLNSIHSLAMLNHAKIIFLYLPPYGSPEREPIKSTLFKEIGEIWIPPDSILINKSNWYDHEHLNAKGANLLSEFLVEKISEK